MTDTAAPAQDRALVGIGWMLLTTVLFVCVTGIVRHLGSDIPAVEAAFIRYAIGLALVLPALRPLLRHWPRAALMKVFVARGIVHGVAVMLWFYAMARIPIAEVTALGYTSPIFVTLGAAYFFGERLHIRRIMAVVIGFIGAMIILRPGFQEKGLSLWLRGHDMLMTAGLWHGRTNSEHLFWRVVPCRTIPAPSWTFNGVFPMTRPAPTTSPLCAGPTAFPARPVATPKPGR